MADNFKINNRVHSQHYRERTEPIKYIIIHCSAPSPEQQIQILDELGLSVHYIISQNGTVTEVLPPEKVAYHAGPSQWYNSEGKSLNGSSIGIELESPNLGQTKDSYHVRQLRKIYPLVKYLSHKYKIRRENILGHSDIAPTRKPDPGVGFPWKAMYMQDLTPWYSPSYLSKETDEIKLLQTIGYDTTNLFAARYAFCRRFIPEEIIIEEDLQKLLDNPYPENFIPQNQAQYMHILRGVALSFEQERQKKNWY